MNPPIYEPSDRRPPCGALDAGNALSAGNALPAASPLSAASDVTAGSTPRALCLDLQRLADALREHEIDRAVHAALDRISREWSIQL